MKRALLITIGSISLITGIIGIFVPVLPTTPLLLLAAICYFRSSKKLYDTLLSNKLIGCYIRNYLEGKGMPLKMKIWPLCLLWTAIILTFLFATDNTVIRVILVAVLLGVTIHIIMIKNPKKVNY